MKNIYKEHSLVESNDESIKTTRFYKKVNYKFNNVLT